jgi:hypothetical protein
LAFLAVVLGAAQLGVACGNNSSPSPFQIAEGGAGGEAGAPASPGVQPPDDSALGRACVDADQCDDGIDCTDDTCDQSAGRCRFTVQHPRCADDVYCNGVELCELGVGCQPGPPVSCSDDLSCTIDTCVEATRSCQSKPRDADGDGDPIRNCGGGDCLDTDPEVNSSTAEVCGNLRDDDCDEQIDEAGCVEPAHDDCADPLLVEQSGTYRLSLVATAEDFPLSCNRADAARRDVVVALVVPDAETDVEVVAIGASTVPIIGLARSCSDVSSELVCSVGAPQPPGMSGVARTVLRGLEPETYPLFVGGTSESPIELRISYAPATPAPSNETCDTALEIVPDENQLAFLADARPDLESACGEETRELVYRFELAETSDLEAYAVALDDFGVPILSLRGEGCSDIGSELGCRRGTPASLFARSLEPGTYYLAVGSTGPSQIDVRVSVMPPGVVPEYEGCDDPPLLASGETRALALETSADSVNPDCLVGAPDATFALELTEASDVLLVGRLSEGDLGGLSLTGPDCSAEQRRACQIGAQSPVRAVSKSVPAGDHRVIAESALGAPMTLTAFVRPAAQATLVAFADTCDDALEIPETGGRFLGNTNSAEADYEASCDFASSLPGGAAEQMLKLVLTEERRVVLDLGLSDYETLLVVRDASSCPGKELTRAGAPGYVAGRSFLDRVLPAGEYFVQIDGYDRAVGNWVLDVFVTDP